MTRGLEDKACSICASAKRKCDRQTPTCIRCKRRKQRCIYPPSRPSWFVRLETQSSGTTSPATIGEDSTAGSSDFSSTHPPHASSAAPHTITPPDLSALPEELVISLSPRLWFATEETWQVYHFIPAEQNTFPAVDLKRYASYVRSWLSDWVRHGSTQFIHSRLYRTRMPQSMRHAFTALSTYEHKTPETEEMILDMLEDSASHLVRENEGRLDKSTHYCDALEHLAQVQALLIYQTIALFDGDIKLRSMAERRIPVLNRWMERMVEQAKSTVCLGTLVIPPDPNKPFNAISLTDASVCEDLLWYSWILAECIRRTWVVASGTQAIYSLLKDGRVDCMGGMMWTSRCDVFEATSATAWERLCSRYNVGMISMERGEELLNHTAPNELNDFAKVVLEITFGTERIERWKVANGD